MKVALLKAHTGGVLGLEMITLVEPLGLEMVAGALEQAGHSCLIVDMRLDGVEPGLKKCRRFDPDMVGIQCNFTTERYRVLMLAQRVKLDFPRAFLVIGGHDASRDWQWFEQTPADGIAIGDGEGVILELVKRLEQNGKPDGTPGLMVPSPTGLHLEAPPQVRGELDELPMPARHLIKDYAAHYYFNFYKPLALVETTRGCPYRCNFCSVWKFHDKGFREKSVDRVVEELKAIKAQHVFFTDDIFWLNGDRAREMAHKIKAANIRKSFKFQTRSDIICRNPDLLELWKECGRLSIFIGLEKIDDAGLKSVNKKNSVETNNRAIKLLQEAGVGYTPNFIVDPEWDHDDFQHMKDWVSETGAYNSGFAVLTPLPGTDLWADVEQKLNTRDWELFDLVHTVMPTRLSMEEFYREYAGLWRHTLDVRYREHGFIKTQLGLGLALATGKLSFTALRKGMNMTKRFSSADTFLAAHRASQDRLSRF